MREKRIRGFRADMRAARERLAALGPRAVSTPYGPVRFAAAGSGPPVLRSWPRRSRVHGCWPSNGAGT